MSQHTLTPGDDGYDWPEPELQVKDVNVIYDPSLMTVTHDYSCPVCRENHAVLAEGIMQPCWKCQKDGWKLSKQDNKGGWLSKIWRR